MKPASFLSRLQHDEVVDKIRAQERNTSGEIRVFVSHKKVADAVAAAQAVFSRLGMTRTRHRNAVLIFVAPISRQFAVIGDQGVHKHCGDEFWRKLADDMGGHFKRGDFMEGISYAIGKIGVLLAAHFPPDATPVNELPDEIAGD